ncbi:hypothetical protein GBAR_LOCUS4472, partial [Geodia barretti]
DHFVHNFFWVTRCRLICSRNFSIATTTCCDVGWIVFCLHISIGLMRSSNFDACSDGSSSHRYYSKHC